MLKPIKRKEKSATGKADDIETEKGKTLNKSKLEQIHELGGSDDEDDSN